ncbi:MAG TPA: SMR family transporter [Amaricoccus sp.]|uniref:SMR family transporter n=1 Tax=Amaricoccus sp. TaxID=1872485 RepID=UPI002D15A555|nr:SMR family transporter [Amaricoccus sp.]HMQ92278.1 SMR family transporter [Amaricoccus sp.]HMR52019.1 SMR family transporter [Amaricoccus sp.]HMR60611.1 SMR family transporter [Amaricoccus sp.]HMT98821.1 SMR family transporter [Amaricoccus sp.]
MPLSLIYVLLGAAIAAEVVATTALARSDGLTRLVPSLLAFAFYAVAFWFLAYALRVMPTGIVYAIWSGLGIVLIAAVSWIWYDQRLDLPALLGLGLIILGVLVVNLFSNSMPH